MILFYFYIIITITKYWRYDLNDYRLTLEVADGQNQPTEANAQVADGQNNVYKLGNSGITLG